MGVRVSIIDGSQATSRLLSGVDRERVGLALLGGPHCVMAILGGVPEHVAPPPAALELELDARHACVDVAAFHPDLEEDLQRALSRVLRGLWEAFGWGLSASPLSEDTPASPVRLRALWRHFRPRLEAADLLAEQHVAELLQVLQRGFSVEIVDDLPELVSRPGRAHPPPAALCFAIGAALVQNRDTPDPARHEALEPAWTRLHEDPHRVATMLAELNGLSTDENLDNLEAAVEDALRARGVRLDVWTRFREVDEATRQDIVHDVLQMFRSAGML